MVSVVPNGVVKARVVIPEFEVDETFISTDESNVLAGLAEVTDAVKTFVKTTVGDEETAGGIVFSQSDDVLSVVPSKNTVSVQNVDESAVKMLSREILSAINLALWEAKKPLIVFPPNASGRDKFSTIALTVEAAIEHVELFLQLGETQQGVFPLVEEYVNRYNVFPYSVFVLWGFALRGLFVEFRVSLNLDEDAWNGVFELAEAAANMSKKNFWQGGYGKGFKPDNRNLDIDEVKAALMVVAAEEVAGSENEEATIATLQGFFK